MTQAERERNAKRVQQYLDSLIKVAVKAREISLHPCKLIEKNVPIKDRKQVASVSLFCGGVNNDLELHIYSGLQAMADLLGMEVTEDHETYATRVEGPTVILSFNYKGCKVFQLGYDEDK